MSRVAKLFVVFVQRAEECGERSQILKLEGDA
jgi:hypothetical protein